ncbi:MAG: DEAD/DEAH box helicase family protein [Clostridiales bacterium]|nr:DEAD/DEAH box helicase family protein [Clostridiales bacterium]
MEENAALKAELTARRAQQQQDYVPKPLELSEYDTRKLYIDEMLRTAGWTEGRDWLNEVHVSGMPNKSGAGRAAYVLYDDAHRPLAVIEAKRTCVDMSKGRQQAKNYADQLEKAYGRRPVIFLTNGFETRIIDGAYPERKVATVYSKRDLEKLFNLRSMRTSLKNVMVDRVIAGRYYQEGAVKAVCDSLRRNRRKALLVMATGSGKTRTVIALCDVLLQNGWVKNILFLADRNSLVTQAKRSYVNLLPDLSGHNLCEEKDNYSAHCVFSTYQTMYNCIDAVQDETGRLFTCGHFDLVICDEAHRSIYNKYRDIFNYFDAPLVGLTATPKDEIDKNTYEIFELENGVPTYGYELAQAVQDGYLVDFTYADTKVKFIEQGIPYDDLPEEEKKKYEATFTNENGELPKYINASALNEWVFNEDTIKKVLDLLMTKGLRIDYGETLGKSIIFAKSHRHAEEILRIFNREYPHLPGYAEVIDNYLTYAQSAIDQFSDPKKLPQIAISVDMLDTGIDVPEVLNLVFFKKVLSKAKFWQMIGRGTRLCPGLLDGEDKNKFYIFDVCGNFEFFRMGKGRETPNQIPLQGAIFSLKGQIVYKLQDLDYQTEELTAFRGALVEDMVGKVRELNRENFAVRQHLKYVERYAEASNYAALTYEDTLLLREELAPLVTPDEDDPKAVRFDALVYGIELAYLMGKKYTRARNDLLKKVRGIAGVANIPEIKAQSELIDQILHTSYLDNAGINEFEHIRENLRNLIKYIPVTRAQYTTNFADEILSVDWNEAELENDDLKNYKAKAEFYVRQHQDEAVIAKLRSNVTLNHEDVDTLEQILWSEVGSKEDYEAALGAKPLGEFVREIVGLDMRAAKEAFAAYLDETRLDSRQIYFVNQIVEYIVHNGVMKDLSVLQEAPFTDQGSIVEVFTDLTVWAGIRKVIADINGNAVA